MIRDEALIKRLVTCLTQQGRPYTRTVSCEGSVESGPYALRYFGFRLGRLKVEMAPNGDVSMFAYVPPNRQRHKWYDGFGLHLYQCLYHYHGRETMPAAEWVYEALSLQREIRRVN